MKRKIRTKSDEADEADEARRGAINPLSRTMMHHFKYMRLMAIVIMCSFALLNLVWCSVTGSTFAVSPAVAAEQGSKRTIDFHSATSLGALYGIQVVHGVEYATWKNRKLLGAAVGKVTVVLPPDNLLCLEPNRRLLDKPELLNLLDPDCLDILFVNASSLADAENQRCNHALAYASHFRTLKEICVDRSDVSDTGLSQLTNLPMLEAISAMLCDIDGSCFPALAKLPKLHALNFWGTHILEANFKYFPLIKNLDYLNLNQTKLTLSAIKEIGKCRSLKALNLAYDVTVDNAMVPYLLPLTRLEKLDLRQNSIDDKCLPALAKMKSLKILDLRRTAVTPAGLLALAPLHLSMLKLSERFYTDLQIKQIRSVCPGALIMPDSHQPIDKDMMRTFAPLQRHGGK